MLDTISKAMRAWEVAVADIESDYTGDSEVSDADIAHAAFIAVINNCTPRVARELAARLGYSV